MRILNLGAGVQSTTVFLMAAQGLIPHIEHSVFADTREEPAAVYQHLAWLRTVGGCPSKIWLGSKGKLGDDLKNGVNSTGGRFASIPCFTALNHEQRNDGGACSEGIVRRQCTREYKIEVVEKIIRYKIMKLKPRSHFPKNTGLVQLFGISADEKGRAKRILANAENRKWTIEFPLIDLKMTRDDCVAWLQKRVPHEVPRSACVFCP